MINKESNSNEKKHHLKIDGNINLHTHSIFCDGKNTLEELIQSAIKKGFSVLGFSSHSIYPFAETWHICPNEHHNYVEQVRKLTHKYRDFIKILCGFEVDFLPPYSQLQNVTKFSIFLTKQKPGTKSRLLKLSVQLQKQTL